MNLHDITEILLKVVLNTITLKMNDGYLFLMSIYLEYTRIVIQWQLIFKPICRFTPFTGVVQSTIQQDKF